MREPGVTRWKHFRNSLSRQARGRSKDTIAIIGLTLLAVVMTLFIFTQQKASLPAWAPFVGEEFTHITGEFATAQAVAPGQGQAVDIAGIQVGKITSVALEDGHAVVGMDITPKYMKLIHPDAELLLRPKTNLNDMVVEVYPGTAPGHLEGGDNIPLAQTKSNTNLDAFLATLDADTRQYLQLLLAGGAQGFGERGHQLSGVFRRFGPFVHYVSELNHAIAGRRLALARVIHDFGELTTELGRRDTQIEQFVTGSKGALGNFANEQQAIQEALVEFPATLTALRSGLASSNRFSLAARPALLKLIPQAQALTPAFKSTERFFAQTTAPIGKQIRPFTRQVRPLLNQTANASSDLAKTTRGFGNALGGLNGLLNELAYKPSSSKQSFFFYAPWFQHDLVSTYNLKDPAGPIQRALPMITCNGSGLAYGAAETKPYLKTLLQGARFPRRGELPVIPADKARGGTISCGPESE